MYQIRFFLDYIFRAKPSIAERVNSTVKGIMFILLTGNSKRRYILLLNEMANTYNKSYHKSIKIKPIEGSKENRPQVWIKQYQNKLKNHQTASQQSRLSTKDLVHIGTERCPFKKGYLEGFSKKLFVVKHAVGNNPTVYKLLD